MEFSLISHSRNEMKIFDEIVRTYLEPATKLEKTFHFLNRSARTSFTKVREVLEHWLQNYPANHRSRLVERFRRDDFWSAWYELFLHQMLVSMQATVEVERQVGSKGKYPDFHVSIGDHKFVIEAVLLTGESKLERAKANRRATVIDAIDKMDVPFFLGVNRFMESENRQISPRKVVEFLTDQLKQIDPEQLVKNHPISRPKLIYRNGCDTARIEFTVLPKNREAWDKKASRVVGIESCGSRWGGSEESLRSAIESKANKYGELGVPFIIAVNTLDPLSIDEREWKGALFGTQHEYVPAGTGEIEIETLNNGFWGTDLNPKRQKVSGVLIGTALPWSIPRMDLSLFRNPSAEFPLPEICWPVRVQDKDGNHFIKRNPDRSIGELFGLDEAWPGSFFDEE